MIAATWKNVSFRYKTGILVGVLMAMTVLTAASYHVLVQRLLEVYLENTSEAVLHGYKEEIKDIIDAMSLTLAAGIEEVNDEKAVYGIFKKLIKNTRFLRDGSGYCFINKAGGTVFVHPVQPVLEGRNLADYKDAAGNLVIKELDDLSQSGGGFVEYWWEKPGKGVTRKLSYARMIPGTQYWIGTGIYIDIVEEKKAQLKETMQAIITSFQTKLMVALILCYAFIAFPMIWLMVAGIVRPIHDLTTAADRFSRGHLDTAIPDLNRRDEIGTLAKAIERLGTTTKLAMARLNLKKKRSMASNNQRSGS